MSKFPSRSSPTREVYNEFQRVTGSNRFIFTQAGIFLMVGTVLGLIPLMIYAAAGTILITLAFTFERPYQLLRALLPYGNWPSHLAEATTQRKILGLALVLILILAYGAGWLIFRQVLLPLVSPSSTNLWCDGSLACILLRRLLS